MEEVAVLLNKKLYAYCDERLVVTSDFTFMYSISEMLSLKCEDQRLKSEVENVKHKV
jgi:hypothetical protein